jgi:pantetheine-phosphate adenylyltransferase
MRYDHPSAIYPGSFDPPTKAHIDLLFTGMRMFPHVTVIVASNKDKKTWFTVEERVNMFREMFEEDKGVPEGVVMPEGLKVIGAENVYVPTMEEAKRSSFVIRGLRTSMDFDYETRLMRLYQRMNSRLQPVYIPTFPTNDMDLISSSMVKSYVGPDGWEEVTKPFLTPKIHAKFVERAKLMMFRASVVEREAKEAKKQD